MNKTQLQVRLLSLLLCVFVTDLLLAPPLVDLQPPVGGEPAPEISADATGMLDYISEVIFSLFVVNAQEFFVLVTLEWTERVKTARSSRPKKQSESKNTPSIIKVLTLHRGQFVTAALAAHGYQKAYIPGPTSGPGMQISWSGFA